MINNNEEEKFGLGMNYLANFTDAVDQHVRFIQACFVRATERNCTHRNDCSDW